jgi:pyruvate-formate lyase
METGHNCMQVMQIDVRKDWTAILVGNQTHNYKDRKYDLCTLWRALSYRETCGLPESIIRAKAFQKVLENITPEVDGGLITGNCTGLRSDVLPAGITEDDYIQLVNEHRHKGQRDFWAGFDHSLADYPTLLSMGIAGLRSQVQHSLDTHQLPGQRNTLRAIDITLKAFSDFIQRCASLSADHGDNDGAIVCKAVAENPPQHFEQAIQLVYFTHLAFKSEGRCHMALGRIDQYLLPFYLRDIQSGWMTEEQALDWLCHLWARLDEVGEVQNICIGGLTPAGEDGTNALSYLCLEATRCVGSPHTNLSARFHDNTPDSFHRACFDVIRTGIGFPAIFNDHVLIQGLVEIGIPLEVARDTCMVGCIETMLAGKQPPWSDSRFNTPLCLTRAMQKLRDDANLTYANLVSLFRKELSLGIAHHVSKINNYIANFPAEQFPDPFLSALTQNCIELGRDINAGGAAYSRFHGIAIMGLATLADSLAALKKLVFEEHTISFDKLMDTLTADFEGNEDIRLMLVNKVPKYGNDSPYVDNIAAQIVQWTAEECLKHQLAGGGQFVAAIAANIQNIDAGREVGATPDGRHAYTPLSDAASPYFGRDLKGPTAFLKSVANPDYHQVLTGSVINMRFDPDHYMDDESAERFLAFTKVFVAERIPELQFNFTSDQTLQAALQEPEKYRNLVVRVSGFSAKFVELAPEVQADILRRRAHT